MKKNVYDIKMFRFIKKMFFTGLTILSTLSNLNPLKCISMNNRECKVRPEIVNVNSIDPVFYHFSIRTSNCSGFVTTSMIPMENCVFLMLLKT